MVLGHVPVKYPCQNVPFGSLIVLTSLFFCPSLAIIFIPLPVMALYLPLCSMLMSVLTLCCLITLSSMWKFGMQTITRNLRALCMKNVLTSTLLVML